MKKFNKYLYDNINREYDRKNLYLYEVSALQEKIEAANKEFEELFGLEQEVTIYTIPLEAFNDMELTEKQMDAVMEMIEE